MNHSHPQACACPSDMPASPQADQRPASACRSLRLLVREAALRHRQAAASGIDWAGRLRGLRDGNGHCGAGG